MKHQRKIGSAMALAIASTAGTSCAPSFIGAWNGVSTTYSSMGALPHQGLQAGEYDFLRHSTYYQAFMNINDMTTSSNNGTVDDLLAVFARNHHTDYYYRAVDCYSYDSYWRLDYTIVRDVNFGMAAAARGNELSMISVSDGLSAHCTQAVENRMDCLINLGVNSWVTSFEK